MKSQWSDQAAQELVALYSPRWGEDLALRTYTARLLGIEKGLVLHGGGNTSVKGSVTGVLAETNPAIFVKASGQDLSTIGPAGHPGVDLSYLGRLRALSDLTDEEMRGEIRTHLLDADSPTPSLETLVHAFLPPKFIDHTHADSILTLTNQLNAEEHVRAALGDGVILLDYVRPGFKLAKASAAAFEANPGKLGMIWMKHGLMTWGETARESYQRTIELVTRAERYLDENGFRVQPGNFSTPLVKAQQRWSRVAPVLRGLLAPPTGDEDRPYGPLTLRSLISERVLGLMDSENGKSLVLTPPLTADHLIRTKAFPLWVDSPDCEDMGVLRGQLEEAIQKYRQQYESYLNRNRPLEKGKTAFWDLSPRVVLLPGVGIACAGTDVQAADICRDITSQTLKVKCQIASMGSYQGLGEAELYDMEYHTWQQAKLSTSRGSLAGKVAVVTGAAGAIGSGISRVLLEQGCQVAVTDLPSERLDGLEAELLAKFGKRVLAVPLDVTDSDSVARGLEAVISAWGGVDLAVINAGLALVASLAEMELEAFRTLEQVNVEGTLLMLSQLARHFELQGTGGDIVVVSTKNVFAPGARFGAYSATKAGAHQLARIASLELAELGVRVNMVAPDAVFSEGERRSGLWAEVGPDRMRARGLGEGELEEYYRKRNLLKARVTAQHVANAVVFFFTRQTPTTGATLPVDGGLPDATPR